MFFEVRFVNSALGFEYFLEKKKKWNAFDNLPYKR